MTTRNSSEDHKPKRQESNREIIHEISAMIEAHPDLRFHQILHSLNIIETSYPTKEDGSKDYEKGYIKDLFYEESVTTLKKINERENK